MRFSCHCDKYIIINFIKKKIILIHLACLIFGLIYLFIKPVQRGFFCDDTSVQYPFRPDTIPMWLLGIYGGVLPIIIVSYYNKEFSLFQKNLFVLILVFYC
jgi:hypothetical protein